MYHVRGQSPGRSTTLMSRSGFLHYNSEAACTEAEALLDASGHSHFAAIPRNAIALAHDPHASRTVINLKKSIAQGTERIRNTAADGDFLTGIPTGVAVDIGDADPRRAANEEQ